MTAKKSRSRQTNPDDSALVMRSHFLFRAIARAFLIAEKAPSSRP
jgi:hypothetical protein